MAKRTAKLEIEGWEENTARYGPSQWLRLKARNGEPLMHSEIVAQPKRARAACIRSFADVLRAEGWTVEPPEVKP